MEELKKIFSNSLRFANVLVKTTAFYLSASIAVVVGLIVLFFVSIFSFSLFFLIAIVMGIFLIVKRQRFKKRPQNARHPNQVKQMKNVTNSKDNL